VLTLAVTPLRKLLGLPELIRYRRMLGLFASLLRHAALHDLTCARQVLRRRRDYQGRGQTAFIAAGFTGFVLLIPLALTSTAPPSGGWAGQRWRRLHRLVYVSALAGVVHYYWQVKSTSAGRSSTSR